VCLVVGRRARCCCVSWHRSSFLAIATLECVRRRPFSDVVDCALGKREIGAQSHHGLIVASLGAFCSALCSHLEHLQTIRQPPAGSYRPKIRMTGCNRRGFACSAKQRRVVNRCFPCTRLAPRRQYRPRLWPAQSLVPATWRFP